MNKIIVETLRDPTTREAVLQVWDLVAAEPLRGLGEHVDDDETAGVVDATHDLVISTLAHPQTIALGHAVVDGFFERFGGYTPGELLTELELDRADLVDDLVRIAPAVVGGLVESGALEQLLRAELTPFYESEVVKGLLSEG